MANQPSLKTAHYGKLLHRKPVSNANSNTTDNACNHITTRHTVELPVRRTSEATYKAKFPNPGLRNSQLVHKFVPINTSDFRFSVSKC